MVKKYKYKGNWGLLDENNNIIKKDKDFDVVAKVQDDSQEDTLIVFIPNKKDIKVIRK